jgi:hypothetical protein
MGRRLSAMQADILDELARVHQPGGWWPPHSVRTLAARVLSPDPTPAQLQSYRRCLRSLERDGLVVLKRSEWWRGRRVDLTRSPPLEEPPPAA